MYKIIAFCKWCQSLPFAELAAHLKGVGVDGVDLPCRPGAPIGPAEAPAKLPEAKRILEDHGLPLVSLVTGIKEATDENERQIEAARNVGVKDIRLAGYEFGPGDDLCAVLEDARRKLEGIQRLLEKHNVRGSIQNHSGHCLEVNVSSTLRLIEHCDPRWIGIQCDPGHLTLSGEPYDVGFDLAGPYLHSVNFKSPRQEYFIDPETNRLSFKPIWVPLRDGMLDVPGVLKTLKKLGYTGPIIVHGEYRTHYYRIEDDMEASGKLIADDVAYIRKMGNEHL